MFESRITIKGQTTAQTREGFTGSEARRQGTLRHTRRRCAHNACPSNQPLFGSLKYDGPAVSLEDMERAIAEGATEG